MARKVKRSGGSGRGSEAGRRRTRLSSKNQATIPVRLLRETGLQAGDELQVEVAGRGEIVLRRVDDLLEAYAGCVPEGTFPAGYLEELREEWE